MIKIIKYSITFIIFSIILSLFVVYFYLLKGISIDNIHTSFFNINKLYIKIDKKIILTAKNININYKKNKNSKKNPQLNFKKIKSIAIKSIHALSYFQYIKLENISINKNHFNLLELKQNMVSLDNNNFYIKTLITTNKNNIILRTYLLKLKEIPLSFHNIYTELHFSNYELDIKSDLSYRDATTHLDVSITKNSRCFYEGKIINISKNTILPLLKQKNIKINSLNIAKIYIHGNKDNLYFKTSPINISNKEAKIDINNINGVFNINQNKLTINNEKSNIIFKDNHINISQTKIFFYPNNNSTIIRNEKIDITNNKYKLNINIIKNRFSYNKIATLSSDLININSNKKTTIKINKFKAQYLNKQLYSYIPVINITYNNINSIIKNIIIEYSNNKIYSKISKLKVFNKQFNISFNHIMSIYKNDILNSSIQKIILKAKDSTAKITDNNLTYNNQNKLLTIINKNANINYLNIKNININNITTKIDISKKELQTTIPKTIIKNIQISKIELFIKNNILNIFFNSNTLLSKELNNILSNFNINIPIYQTSGNNKIKANISYNFDKNKLHTDIKIKVKSSRLMLSKNSYLDINHSNLELKDSNISIKDTLLDYNQSIVNVRYFINKGIINLDKLYIKTDGIFKDLNITNIVELTNYPEQLYIDLNGIDIFLQNLKTNILIHKNIIINIDKLSKFYPYISYLKEYKLHDGNIKVTIANNINICSHITDTNQTILQHHLKPLKKLDINTTIIGNKFHIYNKNIDINLTNDTNLTKINGKYSNLDINITKFVDNNNSDNNNSTEIKAKIKAKNTYVIYDNMKLYSKKLTIDHNTTYTNIESIYKDRNISIVYNNGNLKIYGINIQEKTFKDITNTNLLHDPLINIMILKNKNSNAINGFITIKKGYVKELKALTNILAFINLIPSLVTFQPVGFSTQGYKIKKGHVEFMLYNNIIYLKKLYIEGENMTFKGKGIINLTTKTLDINIDVILMVKLLNNIPIVNYILFGKNNGITLKINLKGDMTNPEVSPNVTTNILTGPLNIIKRTLLTPFRPFMEEK